MCNYPDRDIDLLKLLSRSSILLLLVFAFYSGYTQKSAGVESNKGYSDAISHADKLLLEDNYLQALNEYERAWNLYQRQKYPEKKIDQITKILANPALSKTLFEKTIHQGDSCFLAKDFKNANIKYYNALRIDPAALYPKERLSEISKLYADPENETRYRIILIHAGKALNRTQYDKAINFYQQALLMKPSEKWLNQKITETISLKEKNAARLDPYTRLIMEADNFMDQTKWTEARTAFVKASSLRPKENYPAARIVLIDHLLHFNSTGQRTYATLISDADAFYKLQDYNNAGIHYQVALNMKPEEQYPKSMLKKIEHSKRQVNASPEDYEASVANADILSSAGDQEAALIAFKKCDTFVPGDNYVQSRITELTKQAKPNTSNREAYLIAVSKGDKSVAASNYTKALSEYRYASWLMPDETYPKAKIEEIQLITQKVKPEKEILQSVSTNEIAVVSQNPALTKDSISVKQSAVSETPTLQKTVEYSGIAEKKATEIKEKTNLALTPESPSKIENYDVKSKNENSSSFENPGEIISQHEPVQINSTDKLPKNEISKNNSPTTALPQLADVKPRTQQTGRVEQNNTSVQKTTTSKLPVSKPTVDQQNTALEKYRQAIEFADKARDEKNYTFAVNGYKAALKLKPAEKYPQEQINTINQIQNQSNSSQDNYKSLLSSADKAFAEKDYNKALTTYQKALELDPAQKYPQGKIASINIILGQQKALNENYNRVIASADHAFDEKKYKDAIASYTAALKLRPTEAYPKEKAAQLNTLLGQTSEQQENYLKAIAEADKNYTEKKFEESLSGYQVASQIKPGEAYPKQRIAAINVKSGQQKALLAKYNDAIQTADQAYNTKDFITAITEYKTALALSPSQSYPKEQIESINALLARQKVTNDNYTKAVMTAEKAFAAKDYLLAVSGFQAALEHKPEESYPREKITIINGILALDKEKLDRQYAGYISQADAFYTAQDLLLAQETYKMASLLKPDEDYPKKRYDDIAGTLIAKAKALKEAYEITINDADKAYKSLYMDQAVLLYSRALEIKPGEIYPGQMIARIRKYMLDNSVIEVSAESFTLKKDLEKRFLFKPVDINLRKHNYLVVRARTSGKSTPKLYINYGSESMKNGGVVLKNIQSEILNDFVIDISIQDKWFREDNNWLSFYSENGDLEVASIRISQGK